MKYQKDDDEIDSEDEQGELRKKKKKRFPFHAKVGGRLARARPDRKAMKRQEGGTIGSVRRRPVPGERREPPPLTGPTEGMRRGGVVASKADADLINPQEPDAPAGGKVTQKFQAGGLTESERREGVRKLKATMGSPTGDVIGASQRMRAQDRRVPREEEPRPPFPTPDSRPVFPGPEPRPPLRARGGGVLSAAQRQAMPKSEFALPGKGKGPKGAGSGSYPIPDESHARNALARSSGKPVAAQVRAKVKAKYPDIDVGDE
jgi:hypothetical protein